LIVSGSFQLVAYSLATGQRLWWVQGLSWQPKTVPLLGGDVLYVHGSTWGTGDPGKQIEMPAFDEVLRERDSNRDGRLSFDEATGPNLKESWQVVDLDKNGTLDEREWNSYRSMLTGQNGLFAIRLGGHGDLTGTNVLWRYWKSLPNVPSPLLYNGVIYMVKDGGVVTSLDASTGAVLKQARLRDALDPYFASPVAAEEKVFLVSQAGKVSVLKARGEWEILAVNDLGEECYATPAIADGKLYIRTRKTLFCFGDPHLMKLQQLAGEA
jgi:outer membrane protein assembly factor BamB